MKYDVLKAFQDDSFKVTVTQKIPLAKEVGDVFIPAEINYPANKIAALVADGTLKLVVPVVPPEE